VNVCERGVNVCECVYTLALSPGQCFGLACLTTEGHVQNSSTAKLISDLAGQPLSLSAGNKQGHS
jgi:hypothetical protein